MEMSMVCPAPVASSASASSSTNRPVLRKSKARSSNGHDHHQQQQQQHHRPHNQRQQTKQFHRSKDLTSVLNSSGESSSSSTSTSEPIGTGAHKAAATAMNGYMDFEANLAAEQRLKDMLNISSSGGGGGGGSPSSKGNAPVAASVGGAAQQPSQRSTETLAALMSGGYGFNANSTTTTATKKPSAKEEATNEKGRASGRGSSNTQRPKAVENGRVAAVDAAQKATKRRSGKWSGGGEPGVGLEAGQVAATAEGGGEATTKASSAPTTTTSQTPTQQTSQTTASPAAAVAVTATTTSGKVKPATSQGPAKSGISKNNNNNNTGNQKAAATTEPNATAVTAATTATPQSRTTTIATTTNDSKRARPPAALTNSSSSSESAAPVATNQQQTATASATLNACTTNSTTTTTTTSSSTTTTPKAPKTKTKRNPDEAAASTPRTPQAVNAKVAVTHNNNSNGSNNTNSPTTTATITAAKAATKPTASQATAFADLIQSLTTSAGTSSSASSSSSSSSLGHGHGHLTASMVKGEAPVANVVAVPVAASTGGAKNQNNSKNGFKIPSDILDDLASRFIINVPDMELTNLIRICFQIELAHWFYLDFFCTSVGESGAASAIKLHPCGIKHFALQIFKHIPFLNQHSASVDKVLDDWKQYKLSVPTYGAILISEDLNYCLLVQSYFAKSSWGFPKGKINENEDPVHCASREVFEETGFNISDLIQPLDFIESVINYQYTRLYLVGRVPIGTQFVPRTRNEIKCCEWFPIDSLPVNKNDAISKAKFRLNANSFFMIMPFVKRLKKWVADKKAGIVNPMVAPMVVHGSGGAILAQHMMQHGAASTTATATTTTIQKFVATTATTAVAAAGAGEMAGLQHSSSMVAMTAGNDIASLALLSSSVPGVLRLNAQTLNMLTQQPPYNAYGQPGYGVKQSPKKPEEQREGVTSPFGPNSRSKRQRHKSMGDLDGGQANGGGNPKNNANNNNSNNNNSNNGNNQNVPRRNGALTPVMNMHPQAPANRRNGPEMVTSQAYTMTAAPQIAEENPDTKEMMRKLMNAQSMSVQGQQGRVRAKSHSDKQCVVYTQTNVSSSSTTTSTTSNTTSNGGGCSTTTTTTATATGGGAHYRLQKQQSMIITNSQAGAAALCLSNTAVIAAAMSSSSSTTSSSSSSTTHQPTNGNGHNGHIVSSMAAVHLSGTSSAAGGGGGGGSSGGAPPSPMRLEDVEQMQRFNALQRSKSLQLPTQQQQQQQQQQQGGELARGRNGGGGEAISSNMQNSWTNFSFRKNFIANVFY